MKQASLTSPIFSSCRSLLFAACVALTGCTAPGPSEGGRAAPAETGMVRPGDAVFHYSRSGQAVAIRNATGSTLTHCGIVFRDGTGTLRVAEAGSPVRVTSRTVALKDWVGKSVNGKAEVYRRNNDLSAADMTRLWRAMTAMHDKPYDVKFQWKDGAIYCSEFVYDSYLKGLKNDLGGVQRFGDLDLTSKEVKDLIIKRYPPGEFDTAEPIITPVALTRSGALRHVASLTTATAPLQ